VWGANDDVFASYDSSDSGGWWNVFKKLILSLGIAALIAAVLAMVSDQRGFEELAVRAAIADQTGAHGTKCPLSWEYTDKADIGLISICLKYGLGAYAAAQRYPATAAKVFAVYGEDETFQRSPLVYDVGRPCRERRMARKWAE
jgi:hypothetical protein